MHRGDPFPDVPNNAISLGKLGQSVRDKGVHPVIPSPYSSEREIVTVLHECWKIDPALRPSFEWITQLFQVMRWVGTTNHID